MTTEGRRDRGVSACLSCKKRKIRCSGTAPCGPCVLRKVEDTCVFEEPRKRGPKKRKTEGESPSSHSMPDHLRHGSEAGPSNINDHTPELSHDGHFQYGLPPLDSPVDHLLHLRGTMERNSDLDNLSLQGGSTMPVLDEHEGSSRFAERIYAASSPSLDTFRNLLGPTPSVSASAPAFASHAHESFSETTGTDHGDEIRRVAEDPATIQFLYSIYWTFVHTVWPVIYRPSFSLPISPLLEASIMAIASRKDLWQQSVQSGNSPVGITHSLSPELGNYFFARAMSLLSPEILSAQSPTSPTRTASPPPISLVQSLVLLGLREVAQGQFHSGWRLTGLAIRVAFELDLHLLVDASSVRQQERSRVIWCCFVLDKYVSLICGRPYMARSLHVDAPLPSPFESDEYGVFATDVSPIIPDIASRFPNVRTRTVSTFNSFVGIAVILELIVDSMGLSPRRRLGTDSQLRLRALVDIDAALEIWRTKNQALWTEDPDLTAVPANMPLVKLWYHATSLILHRPFVPQSHRTFHRALATPMWEAESQQTSFSICSNSANEIVDLVTLLDDRFGLYRLTHSVVFIIFQAGIMQLALANASDVSVAQRGAVSLDKCTAWLREISDTYQISPDYLEVLTALQTSSKRQLRPQDELHKIVATRIHSRAPSPASALAEILGSDITGLDLPPPVEAGEQPDQGVGPSFFGNLHDTFFGEMPFTMPMPDNMDTWVDFTSNYDNLTFPG